MVSPTTLDVRLPLMLTMDRMGLKKDGAPIEKYFKEVAYESAIPAFKAQLKEIGEAQGWTLEELQKRFSNKLWDEIIYS